LRIAGSRARHAIVEGARVHDLEWESHR
jgi:hypothetical protein